MKKSFLVSVVVVCSAAFGQTAVPPANDAKGIPKLGQASAVNPLDKVKAVKRLPVTSLSIVETVNGQVYLVSDNGRVGIIGGRWMDMWEGREFSSIADSATLDKLNFGRMGISLDDFSPFVIGSGGKTVTVFVDPLCTECRDLVKQMPALGKQYTFNVILLPLQGKEAGVQARRMHCSPNKKLALDAFLTGSMKTLPDPADSCDVAPVQKAMLTATILGIRAVPHVILPDFTTISVKGRGNKLEDIIAHK